MKKILAEEKSPLQKLREERKKANEMYSDNKGKPAAKAYKSKMRALDKKIDAIVDAPKKPKKEGASLVTMVLSRLGFKED